MYLNLFRPTGATALANSLTESLLRKRQGWSPSSKMPERYVHLVDEDLDEAYLKLHGIIKKGSQNDIQEDMPIKCTLCNYQNVPANKICSDCNRPLDIKTAINMKENEKLEKEAKLKDNQKLYGLIEALSLKVEKLEYEKRELLTIPDTSTDLKN